MGFSILSEFRFRHLPSSRSGEAAVVVEHHVGPFPCVDAPLKEIVYNDSVTGVYETPDGIQILAQGLCRFWISPDGRRVRYCSHAGAATSDIEYLLLNPVLNLAFQQQRHLLVHAGCVLVDDLAVAFTGPSGIGKSTLAAYLARRGHRIVSDDVLLIRDGSVCGTIPMFRLWRQGLELLGMDADAFPRVATRIDKHRVDIDHDWGIFAGGPFRLHDIYFLEPHDDLQPMQVHSMKPGEAALDLLRNVHLASMLRGDRAAAALTRAAETARAVRCRRIAYQRTADCLPALRDAFVGALVGARRDASRGATRE